ncbi:SANT/Myb-like DNA-binding domain-containing protein [Bradyrhizobium sp.]|uniref:SANT/Myb-like DNA-binding domain-containing protein n=1 Tax=Bradyrhizobium sp. TaxID=376 RepID=UPI003C43DFA4
MGNIRDNYKPWSQEDSARLYQLADNRPNNGKNWPSISKEFQGRSPASCREHYFAQLRRRSYSCPPGGPRRFIEPVSRDRSPRQEPINLPAPATLTAFLCGDPVPGRSALDRKQLERAA